MAEFALPETEQCGKWTLKFDWADQYDYSKKVSQVTAETGGSRIITDTIILSSVADPNKMVKISIMKYGKRTQALVDPLSLKRRANESLVEWGDARTSPPSKGASASIKGLVPSPAGLDAREAGSSGLPFILWITTMIGPPEPWSPMPWEL
jgi:hypothetical protein